MVWIFQSTLPAGEATGNGGSTKDIPVFQSTLPAGEATSHCKVVDSRFEFQSTLPAGEATDARFQKHQEAGISIHASRGGSDTR